MSCQTNQTQITDGQPETGATAGSGDPGDQEPGFSSPLPPRVSPDPKIKRRGDQGSTEGELRSKDKRQRLATGPKKTGNRTETEEEVSVGLCPLDPEQVADSNTTRPIRQNRSESAKGSLKSTVHSVQRFVYPPPTRTRR